MIVALMGSGLKLDRMPGWRSWSSTWRLLAITMPLTIAATTVLGWWGMGLAPATAVLVGASLAPTDPVLAADVQVESPYEGEEPEVRFALTSEAGLNDGLAFPFTNAAIAMAVTGAAPAGWIGGWLADDVVYKLGVGLVGGVAVGAATAHLVFTLAARDLVSDVSGFVALAATLLTYGLTELAGGYGFLAVFVAAVVLRHHAGSHHYHEALYNFSEEAERLLMSALLVLLGGAIDAGVLAPVGWPTVLVAVLLITLVRPVAGWAGLLASGLDRWQRGAIAFFGIRGMGSVYYLAHGLNEADFDQAELAWAVVALVIVASTVIHGIASTPAMRSLARRGEA